MSVDWGTLIVDDPDNTVLLNWLKDYLGIDRADATNDDALNRALMITGSVVETYLDRIIAKREVTEDFPFHWGTVELHESPVDVQADLTVWLDGVAQNGNYRVFLYRGKTAFVTRIGHNWDTPMDWRAFEHANVVYTAGYDPLPVDLAEAICYTAGLIYQSDGTGNIPGGGGSGEVKSVTVYDVGSISYDVGGSSGSSGSGAFAAQGVIPDTAAQMLSRYKRMSA